MKFLFLLLLISSSAYADTLMINERASMKIFFTLARNDVEVRPLSHRHDREYATQEIIRVEKVNCMISLRPTCTFVNESSSADPTSGSLSGQDAWDVGFHMGEAGVARITLSGEKYQVQAQSITCILKGAGKTASCSVEE